MDEPERAMGALWRAAHVFDEITADIWKHLPLWHGGYFDGMYQLWAPGPIIRMQEDASGLYSPALYRRFLQPLDRYLASRYANSFIHLHSTSMFILDAFLEIEELRCFEINHDVTGPSLVEMLPYFQAVQGGTVAADPRLVHAGRGPAARGHLDPRGLYLLSVTDLRETEALRPVLGM